MLNLFFELYCLDIRKCSYLTAFRHCALYKPVSQFQTKSLRLSEDFPKYVINKSEVYLLLESKKWLVWIILLSVKSYNDSALHTC